MSTYQEQNIQHRIRKTFSCEGINEPICKECVQAFRNGNMPKIQDIQCRCVCNGVERICNFSMEYIEKKMRQLGVYDILKENVKPDPDEEGEWR